MECNYPLPTNPPLGFGLSRTSSWPQIDIPYWPPTIGFGVLAAIPWLRRRFTLRTLLIATTLLAVVLGLIVWLR
jgi:hypothetical protein